MRTRGQRIGLLGGSFDPAHEGHAHITREALRRFDLDEVWWLVSPGNPLKLRKPAPLDRRMKKATEVMDHPRVHITDLENQLGTIYTADTIAKLVALYPTKKFVWLMGADSMAGFDKWDRWRQIIETVPMGVLARPGQRISARISKAARIYRNYRILRPKSRSLADCDAPAWCFVNVPMNDMSSTKLRNGAKAT